LVANHGGHFSLRFGNQPTLDPPIEMNLESIIELALAIGRVVLALVFVGCILTLLFTQ
jgi:hypothetical protein